MTWKDQIREIYGTVVTNSKPVYELWKAIGSDKIDEVKYLPIQNGEFIQISRKILEAIVNNCDKIRGFRIKFNHLGYVFRIIAEERNTIAGIVCYLSDLENFGFEVYLIHGNTDIEGYIALPGGKYCERIDRIKKIFEKMKICKLYIEPCVYEVWGVPRDGLLREIVRLIVEPYKYSGIGLLSRRVSVAAGYDQFMKILDSIDFENDDIDIKIVDIMNNNSLYNHIRRDYSTINDEPMRYLLNILSICKVYSAVIEKTNEGVNVRVYGRKEDVKAIYDSIRPYIIKENSISEGYFDVIIKEDIVPATMPVTMSTTPQTITIEFRCPKCGFYCKIETNDINVFREFKCPFCGISIRQSDC